MTIQDAHPFTVDDGWKGNAAAEFPSIPTENLVLYIGETLTPEQIHQLNDLAHDGMAQNGCYPSWRDFCVAHNLE